jgi:TolB-like protein
MQLHFHDHGQKQTIGLLKLVMGLTTLLLFVYSLGFSKMEMSSLEKDTTRSPIKRVAILPFDNVSDDSDAAKRITTIFLTQLFAKEEFEVMELGEVEKVLIEERVRNTGEIEIAVAKKLGEKLNVDYLILGSVVEYKLVHIGNNDYPVIGITARAIDTKTGQLVWSDHQYGRGNQREKIFGIGRIVSLSQLSELIVDKLVISFEKKLWVKQYNSKKK